MFLFHKPLESGKKKNIKEKCLKMKMSSTIRILNNQRKLNVTLTQSRFFACDLPAYKFTINFRCLNHKTRTHEFYRESRETERERKNNVKMNTRCNQKLLNAYKWNHCIQYTYRRKKNTSLLLHMHISIWHFIIGKCVLDLKTNNMNK